MCKRKFAEKRMLLLHLEAVHKKVKPYLCNYCGKNFASKSTLNLHIRKHTGKGSFGARPSPMGHPTRRDGASSTEKGHCLTLRGAHRRPHTARFGSLNSPFCRREAVRVRVLQLPDLGPQLDAAPQDEAHQRPAVRVPLLRLLLHPVVHLQGPPPSEARTARWVLGGVGGPLGAAADD